MKHYRTLSVAILFLALALTGLAAAEEPAAEDRTDGPAGVVNVNTADAAQLALLPRVGPALAGRILDYREENGDLEKPEDLMMVRGIGEKTFELMSPWVAVSGETTLSEKVRASSAAKDD